MPGFQNIADGSSETGFERFVPTEGALIPDAVAVDAKQTSARTAAREEPIRIARLLAGDSAVIGTFVATSGPAGWRWALALGMIPALYSLAIRLGMPESVRFLEKKGRHEEAERIVRDFEALREQHFSGRQWWTLGQSYGGFLTLQYLSHYPESVVASAITGGIPVSMSDPEGGPWTSPCPSPGRRARPGAWPRPCGGA